MRKKMILTNDFHGTSAIIYADRVRKGLLFVSEAQATSARNKLCGADDCYCGNSLGEQPVPQDCMPTTRGYLYFR